MLLCAGGGMLRAQQGTIIQRPLVIPARANSTAGDVAAASKTAPIANAPDSAAVRRAAARARQPEQAPLEDRWQPALMPAASPAPARDPSAAKHAPNSEMIARMRIAVGQIAAEHGNPVFAHIFTNDPLQAQLMRKRIQLAQRMDLLKSDIDSLEQKKLSMKREIETTQRELLALQQQAEALAAKIQKASTLLSLAK